MLVDEKIGTIVELFSIHFSDGLLSGLGIFEADETLVLQH
jgi:hypothetical protein